jgi:hypothetical protein
VTGEEAVAPVADPPVCRMIRAKGAGVPYGEPVRWSCGFQPNAVYWCLRTADPIGPDDGPVHPHTCIGGRECFEEAARPT